MLILNQELTWFADYIANGLFSESFGLPEMCWRAPVHFDIFHVIILCETDLLFNKLYLQIHYRTNRYIVLLPNRAFTKSTLILS